MRLLSDSGARRHRLEADVVEDLAFSADKLGYQLRIIGTQVFDDGLWSALRHVEVAREARLHLRNAAHELVTGLL
jgi:hypothetical protein